MHTPAVTTQEQHPVRASLRTFVQVWVPSIVAAVTIVPEVIQIIIDETTGRDVALPGWLYAILLGIATACSIVAAIFARVMAIPGVNGFFERFRLGSEPNVDVHQILTAKGRRSARVLPVDPPESPEV
jgi:hypothetical protein